MEGRKEAMNVMKVGRNVLRRREGRRKDKD